MPARGFMPEPSQPISCPRRLRPSHLSFGVATAAVAALLACSSASPKGPPDSGVPDGGPVADGGDGGVVDAGPPNPVCVGLQLPTRPFVAGAAGAHRSEVAGDFTLPLLDGSQWKFSEQWTGCESYVFLTNAIPTSQVDGTPVLLADWPALLAASPLNVHYFVLSLDPDAAAANRFLQQVQQLVNGALAGLPPAQAASWQSRIHLVSGNAPALADPIRTVAGTWGAVGFAIDRQQRYRGVGYFSDIHRYDAALAADAGWGWLSNLAYAANEVAYMNAEALVRAQLDAETATVVTLWDRSVDGGVISEFAEKDVVLPSASAIAGFDTLEVEVTQLCPSATDLEFNSCGAWDYYGVLGITDPTVPVVGDGGPAFIDLARFVTAYHRETHWVEDISPMLARLKEGGTRHFKWSWAPPWNVQPTATELSLRFSNSGKGYAPEALLPLWYESGVPFDETYNPGHPPKSVTIPADAKRVELWMFVTGGGDDPANGCAEFCDHQHKFTVGSTDFLVDFPAAGHDDQCIRQQLHGMVPNQGGTWWLGRGGWCPGQQVTPQVFDVTSAVTPGQSATVAMESFLSLNGQVSQPPAGGTGQVNLEAMLVAYH